MDVTVGCIFGICFFLQGNPCGLMLKHHEVVNPKGGSNFITPVDHKTILTVDSHTFINLWEF